MKKLNVKYWVSAIVILFALIFLIASLFMKNWQLLLILSVLLFLLYKIIILYTGIKKSPIKDMFRFLCMSPNRGWADISKLRKKDGSFINYTRRDKHH